MIALGIDIGGSSVKAALVSGGSPDQAPRPLATARSPEYFKPTIDALEHAIRNAARQVLAAHTNLPSGQPITRIGLCLPGLYDPLRGVIQRSVNVPALVDIDLHSLIARALAAQTPLTLRVVSDAHAAAYDWWGTHKPAGRLLGISIGTGVGGCVLDGGRLLRVTGEGDSSGHFGQIDVGLDIPGEGAPIGPDGGRGSVEAYLGLPSLRARYGPNLAADASRWTVSDPPLAALIRLLRIAHAIYRPHHIVLLGGVGIRLAAHTDRLRAAANEHLTSVARAGWSLSAGEHDFHAARGAASLAPR